ncbi:hypothetical protein [Rhodococcus sp. JVH1]|uniref:hypothetical protein n=1 Tax=Rhodococcus sp. JVH1 TaxID=745408 RepID=UPI0002720D9C|nr:hypothetical protein [Rhodococcus sp. JVH1]EJI98341.1 hypothetical protein JVH1_4209 [Rhodococcus sp. JVH1]
MNSGHEVDELLFYDPQAEIGQATTRPDGALAGSVTPAANPESKTGEEIHRMLFSAQ